ncbi:hypothetical protein L917_10543 [Phytophthora nicotianae]|uniref:Uncharacterized protein n=1 Tax=Phytophthora nicotianae TaxID=4792 RepID=W2L2K2_PHYNI|nr:hypothetical protein L917_10543 [Phytophthora nicotianae]
MVFERFSHLPQHHLHQCQQLRPDLRRTRSKPKHHTARTAVQHPTGDVPYRFPVGRRTWGGSNRYAATASTRKHGEQVRNTCVPKGRRTRALEGAYGRAVARRISSQGTIVVKRLGNLENVRRMEMDQSAARGRLLQVHNQNILIRTIILEAPSFWSSLDRQGAIIAILDRRSSPIWCYHFDNPGSKW